LKTPLQIGITGGIGSGKSTVCRIFQTFGTPVYDADSHAKNLMTTDGILVSAITKEFGDLAFNADGSLNRQYLAENVFHDQKKLDKLNSLVHPRVKLHYEHWVTEHGEFPYVLKEAALLFEANSHKGLDKVIVVSAPEELRISRVLKRDAHRSVEQIKGIVEKQMPEDKKLEQADYIIVNDDSQLVIPQVLDLHRAFLQLAKRG
jgi:dephospho-CoA kinase